MCNQYMDILIHLGDWSSLMKLTMNSDQNDYMDLKQKQKNNLFFI